jgi:hypothetical protein
VARKQYDYYVLMSQKRKRRARWYRIPLYFSCFLLEKIAIYIPVIRKHIFQSMQGCPSMSQQNLQRAFCRRTCDTDRSSVIWNENDEHHNSFNYLSAPRVRNVPSLYPHAYILKKMGWWEEPCSPTGLWFGEYSEKTNSDQTVSNNYDKDFVVSMII